MMFFGLRGTTALCSKCLNLCYSLPILMLCLAETEVWNLRLVPFEPVASRHALSALW